MAPRETLMGSAHGPGSAGREAAGGEFLGNPDWRTHTTNGSSR
jgi:hypothetical protein